MAEMRCPACGAINRVPETRVGEPARCGKCKAPLTAASTKPVAVTDAEFERTVLGSPIPVLLDCWADWCGPCHMLAPTIDALARDYAGRVLVAKLDVDANPDTANRFQIQGIPTLLVFKDGKLVDRVTGVQPRGAIDARLQPLLAAR
jgi:thioredoxin 2